VLFLFFGHEVVMSESRSLSSEVAASDARSALLAQRLKRGKSSPQQQAPAPLHERPLDTPLVTSAGQKRIWLFQELHPTSIAYHMSDVYRVRGDLDVPRLHEGVNRVIARHEILRTRFAFLGDAPQQIIEPSLSLDVPCIDLSAVAVEARVSAVEANIREIVSTPFELSQCPLLRFVVLQLSPAEHVLVLVMHHIVGDEVSVQRFWTELSSFYAGATADSLAAMPAQYVDYALQQEQWLKGSVAQAQLAFWKGRLSGSPAAHDLPTDYARPSEGSYRGAQRGVSLNSDVTRRVREYAAERSVTPAMLMLAAYALLLHRYSGQDEVLIGIPVSERVRAGYEDAFGFFLNSVALRLQIAGDESFNVLLQQVRERILEALDHQELPFDQVVTALNLGGDPSYHPLFQVMFAWREKPTKPALQGLTVEPMRFDRRAAQFDIVLFGLDSGDQVELEIEFSTDLYKPATIERFLCHLSTLLEALVSSTDAPLRSYDYLSTNEREQLLRGWNQTTTSYAKSGLIAELMAQQARATPDAPALLMGNRSISYAEFDSRAGALACLLLEKGAQSGRAVALCFERSIEMFIAMYACLKIGCPYVPVDPEYPPARIDYMLRDSDVHMALTASHLKAIKGQAIPVLAVDKLALNGDTSLPSAPPVGAQTPAYIIYTSGSTGQPKGVVITHGALTHSTLARHVYYEAPVSRYLLLSPFVFDSSVAGIYWTLTQGGALVLPEAWEERNSDALLRLIHDHKVTHTLCLPSLYDVILASSAPEQIASLRAIIVAGEACLPATVNAHYRMLPAAALYNEYGPTEGTVWSTVHQIMPEDAHGAIPIGRPIPNVQTYILDPYGQPAPIGVPGELYIAGAGLAVGYLNQPALTAEKFVHLPLTGERAYRTGDRARYRSDGTLEFLGRVDYQVKVRGHRIELGEVEAVLLQHSGVRAAVVLTLPKDEPAAQSLVAFLTLTPDTVTDRQALHDFATGQMPAYMVPNRIHMLDVLPLTFNGKVDRNALAQYDAEHEIVEERAFIAPRNPTEAAIAEVWSELLGISDISMDDDFLELGGHSLLAMRVIAQINRRLNVKLDVGDIVEHPTIAALARRAAPEPAPVVPDAPPEAPPPSSPHVVTIHHQSKGASFWGIAGSKRDVFGYTSFTKQIGSHVSIFALRLPGSDDQSKPIGDIPALAAYFIKQMKAFHPQGPYVIAGSSIYGLVAYEIGQQLLAAGEPAPHLVMFETVVYGEATRKVFGGRWRFVRDAVRYAIWRLRFELGLTKHTPEERQAVRQELRKSPDDARDKRVWTALTQATISYKMKPYVGDILYFSTEASRSSAEGASVLEQWKTLARGNFDVVSVPGRQHNILAGQYVTLVADAMGDRMRRIF
jgi:amino acid adenylation domain-containing protein